MPTERAATSLLPYLTAPKSWLTDRLAARIEHGESIASRHPQLAEMYQEKLKDAEAWSAGNYELLHRAFGDSSVAAAYERRARLTPDEPSLGLSDDDGLTMRIRDAVRFLRSVSDRLELVPATAGPRDARGHDEVRTEPSRKVFVVHGHDAETREIVARFLSQLDLDPIILHEQPSAGSTVIEKLERHSDVGFAVVLLTPDDIGHATGQPARATLRARQNVIFELGYFVARLGRNRVCALHVDDVEIPSDYHGVIYIHVDDAGAWRLKLARDIKSAGIDVDLNKAL